MVLSYNHPMDFKKNYYQVLQVQNNASAVQIKKAYHKMVLQWHPDRVSDSEKDYAEEIFKEIVDAYYVLGHTQRRRDYDYRRKASTFSKTEFDSSKHWEKQYYEEFVKRQKQNVYPTLDEHEEFGWDKKAALIISLIYLIVNYHESYSAASQMLLYLVFLPLPLIFFKDVVSRVTMLHRGFSNESSPLMVYLVGWVLLLIPVLLVFIGMIQRF
jgi:hypothetical protein